MDWSKIKAFCLDISGVLYDSNGSEGGCAIEGSIEAINTLKSAGFPFCLVTNESQTTREKLVLKLNRLGFSIPPAIVFTPPIAVRSILEKSKRRPHLLVHPDVLPEFGGLPTHEPNALVIADAAEIFSYSSLNQAFQVLLDMKEPVFYTLGRGRYYKQGSNLVLDVGPFTCALEYATGITAEVVGKPSPMFFQAALDHLGLNPQDVAMVGDDIVSDIGGAQTVGMKAVQVRTGKFRPSDEPHATVIPDMYVNNLNEVVNLFFASR